MSIEFPQLSSSKKMNINQSIVKNSWGNNKFLQKKNNNKKNNNKFLQTMLYKWFKSRLLLFFFDKQKRDCLLTNLFFVGSIAYSYEEKIDNEREYFDIFFQKTFNLFELNFIHREVLVIMFIIGQKKG